MEISKTIMRCRARDSFFLPLAYFAVVDRYIKLADCAIDPNGAE
jgi:hypothetical protein